MSTPHTPDPVKWFLSVIFSDEAAVLDCLQKLKDKYGPIDYISKPLPFDQTGYYQKEMGSALLRYFLSFRDLADPAGLVQFKLFTNQLEQSNANQMNRTINLDPGYIAMSHLILATGKPAPHRPYLGEGIYADLTLVFESGKFKTLPWTYPDYAGETIKDLLERLREEYKQQLKSLKP